MYYGNNFNPKTLEVDKDYLLKAGVSVGYALDTASVTGLNDLNVVGGYSLSTPATYSIVIDTSGTPDTFTFDDGSGVSAPIPMVASSPIVLSNGFAIAFGSDTGHTPGDTFIVTISAASVESLKIDTLNAYYGIGDVGSSFNSTYVIVDDSADFKKISLNAVNEVSVTAPIANFSGNIDVIGEVLVPTLKSQVIVDQSTAVTRMDLVGNIYYDSFGNAWLNASEVNSRRFYSANGTEAITVSNSQVNVGQPLRCAEGAELLKQAKQYANTLSSTTTLNATSSSMQRISGTSGSIDITLPSSSNAGMTFHFRNVSSNNAVLKGTIDGVTDLTMVPGDRVSINGLGTTWETY
jgi:hypothetical protein